MTTSHADAASVVPPQGARVVAAFDVDGTLTVRDCVAPFLVSVGGRRRVLLSLLGRPLRTLSAALRRDRDRLKELVVGGTLRGRRVDHVESIGERFAARVVAEWMRDDTVGRLRWHQRSGHRTVLVSASLSPYLRPLGRHLGVDAVLCAEPLRTGDVFGDGLDGANCRRAEKVRRLEAWMSSMNLTDVEVWAYGDSEGDRELLARADRAEFVRGATLPPVPAGYPS